MGTTILIVVAAWIVGSAFAGLGVGRVIARADSADTLDHLEREHRDLLAAR